MSYSFGPLCHPDLETIETPVSAVCLWCDEAIAEGDSGFVFRSAGSMPVCDAVECLEQPEKWRLRLLDDGFSVYHWECFLRAVVGSATHVLRQCSCFIKGAAETDPPELTKRQAARLAVELWEKTGR